MAQPRFAPALTNLPLLYQGKTRDTFPAKNELMAIVATRRLSTHDVIHLSEVPFKDEVLTALTVFWLTTLLDGARIPHHLVAFGDNVYDCLPGGRAGYPRNLHHRAIIVRKLDIHPREFIVRGYLAGSLYKKYYSLNLPNPYGVELEPGLPVMHPLSPPIFTPTEKSDTDDPLNADSVRNEYPKAVARAMQVFLLIRGYLRGRGLELVDSKFELGLDSEGETVVGDEVATPDSSRFCNLSDITAGREPSWLDKQVARDEAERIWRTGPKVALEFSQEVVQKLSETYLEVFYRITGVELAEFQRERLD